MKIPKVLIFRAMRKIEKATLQAPVRISQVVISGLDCNVNLTENVEVISSFHSESQKFYTDFLIRKAYILK